MKALFGNGQHPLADQIRQAALDAGLSEREAEKACRLGRPFAVRTNGSPEFHQALKRRYVAANLAAGRPANAKLDPDRLAQIRSEVAAEFFAREFGRAPRTPLELHRAVAIWPSRSCTSPMSWSSRRPDSIRASSPDAGSASGSPIPPTSFPLPAPNLAPQVYSHKRSRRLPHRRVGPRSRARRDLRT